MSSCGKQRFKEKRYESGSALYKMRVTCNYPENIMFIGNHSIFNFLLSKLFLMSQTLDISYYELCWIIWIKFDISHVYTIKFSFTIGISKSVFCGKDSIPFIFKFLSRKLNGLEQCLMLLKQWEGRTLILSMRSSLRMSRVMLFLNPISCTRRGHVTSRMQTANAIFW